MHYYNTGLGYSPVARHYWGNHCCFLFLEVLRCFSSLGWRHRNLPTAAVLQTAGLSHSEIPGSEVICTYPGLIAAYHVLHRLHEPRHPPCALIHFLGSAVPLCFKWTATHTFSCVFLKTKNISLYLSFTLQFRVSTCQRSIALSRGVWRITDSNR